MGQEDRGTDFVQKGGAGVLIVVLDDVAICQVGKVRGVERVEYRIAGDAGTGPLVVTFRLGIEFMAGRGAIGTRYVFGAGDVLEPRGAALGGVAHAEQRLIVDEVRERASRL